MKHFLLILTVVFLVSCADNKSIETTEPVIPEKTTVYYLIRHAEKDRSNPNDENPDLNEEGLKRAQNWARIFSAIKLDAVYASNYNRTQQTAQPTANSKNLPINTYDPHGIYESSFFEITEGMQILVVGHSNTIPRFANFLIDEEKYKHIPDSIDGRLYVVTKTGDKASSFILNLE